MEDQREIGMAGRATEGGDGAEAEPVLGFRDPCLVIWDVFSCPWSKYLDLKVHDILPMIRRRLSCWGYSGPIQMLAIGRSITCARCNLTDTGILFTEVTCLNLKHSGNAVLSAMLSWIKDNPAPANILLIARDRCYPSIVRSLHQRNYNILHQQKCKCPGKKNHYDYCWDWSELIDGKQPQRSQDNDHYSYCGDWFELPHWYLKYCQDKVRLSLLREPKERRYDWAWSEPSQLYLKHCQDKDGLSLLREPIERRDGPDVADLDTCRVVKVDNLI